MTKTVKIESMAYGPEGIGHLANGKTVFVSGAVSGDVAEVEITQDKKTFAKGRAVKIVEPSPFRATHLPKDAIACGAGWAVLSYDAQLEEKKRNVENALIRVAHMDKDAVDGILGNVVACKRQWGYRNKIELTAFKDDSGKFNLGSHEQGSDRCIPLSQSPLANNLIEKSPKALSGALRYIQGQNDLGIFRVGVRGSVRTKSVEVALWTTPGPFPRNFTSKALKDAVGATSVVRVISEPGKARKVKRVEVLDGSGNWKESMRCCIPDPDVSDASFSDIGETSGEVEYANQDHMYRVSAPSFFQVNTSQAERLVECALAAIRPQSGMKVADLYCGVGTFSIPLATTGADVYAIELSGSSVRDLRYNCDHNGVHVDIVCDDAKRAFPSIGKMDALIVDPPRCGLDKSVIEHMAAVKAHALVYVSCDPQTFARDVVLLKDAGYALQSVLPVDMFPQTYHIENVGVFRL